MLDRLREEHETLLAMLPRTEGLLKPDAKSDFAPIAITRQAFVSTLRDHLRFKNAFVYRILLTSRRRVDVAIARAVSAEGQALVDTHAAHVERWGASEIASDWRRYCETSIALIGTIRAHIRNEQRQIYPLLVGTRCPSEPSAGGY